MVCDKGSWGVGHTPHAGNVLHASPARAGHLNIVPAPCPPRQRRHKKAACLLAYPLRTQPPCAKVPQAQRAALTWKKRLPALLTIMAVRSASFMRSPSSAAGNQAKALKHQSVW